MRALPQEPSQIGPERESQVQARVTDLFRSVGAFVYSTSQNRPSRVAVGLPDLIVLLPRGLGVVFFETKAPKGKQSDSQVLFEARCAQSGTPYVCGGLEEARAALELAGLIL